MDLDPSLTQLHRDLGWRRLSAAWSKLEIVLGLIALGCGVIAANDVARANSWSEQLGTCSLSLSLMTLGGYLALAGHRSHLYRSQTRLAAYLIARQEHRQPTNG